MAIHEFPDGFIYDDEGKIAVQLVDDKPFDGVKGFLLTEFPPNQIYNPDNTFTRNSIAFTEDGEQVDVNEPRYKDGAILIEEGTTNLVAPYSYTGDPDQVLFYPDTLASGKTWADCWDEEEKAFILGHGITVYRIWTNEINLGQTYPAGTKVTISWKHKGYFWYFVLYYYDSNAGGFVSWNKDSDEIEIKGDASLDFWESTYGLHIKLNGIKTNTSGEPEKLFDRWYNVEITFTLPVATDKIKLLFDGYNAYQVNTVGLLRHIQVEVKPYATTFTTGTRIYEKLAIPTNNTISPQEGTIAIRFYYPEGGLSGYHSILNIGNSQISSGRMNLFWLETDDHFYLQFSHQTNGTYDANAPSTPLGVGWHTIVVSWKYVGNDSNPVKFYLDGVYLTTVNVPNNKFLTSFVENYAYLGNVGGSDSWSCNTYFDFVAFWNRALTDEEAITYSQLDYPVYHSTTCKGRFHVALDKLGINPASDDFVIYLWKKPIIGNTGSEYTTSGGNYITIGNPYSGGYISFGKLESTDQLRVFVRYSDNGTAQATATLPSDYWGNWHQEVLIKSGSTIKYYFDGSLKITLNLSKPLHSTFSYGLNFGGYESYYVTPCIVANMLVAKFDSSIWTDNYINELYQAKKAFLGQ